MAGESVKLHEIAAIEGALSLWELVLRRGIRWRLTDRGQCESTGQRERGGLCLAMIVR